MKRNLVCLAAAAALLLASASAFASVTISNKDSKSYKLLLNSSESCFSGTHTSISSNTTTSVGAGWACLDEVKPAVKLEDGKSYVIKGGKIEEK